MMHPHDCHFRYALRRVVECSLALDKITQSSLALPPPDLDLDLAADNASFLCEQQVSSTADCSILDEEPFFLFPLNFKAAARLPPPSVGCIDDIHNDIITNATNKVALGSIIEKMFFRGWHFIRESLIPWF